jgi:hypothetical protein
MRMVAQSDRAQNLTPEFHFTSTAKMGGERQPKSSLASV